MISKKSVTFPKSLLLFNNSKEIDELNYSTGDCFLINKRFKADKGLKDFIKSAGSIVLAIDTIEVNFKGEIGYRLKYLFIENRPQDITLGTWWVSQNYLDNNFRKIDKSALRFILLNID